jgi:pre-mRNA-splicing factor ATP-dependent RNA helicase DHX38/PRP16
MKCFDSHGGMDALVLVPETQANARQRSGRAGRTRPGKCWRLFTERAYHFEMLPSNIPEIQRSNLGNVILLLKSLGISNINSFELIDPPPMDNLVKAMHQLWMLGALSNNGSVTSLGSRIVEYPLDPPLAKMVCVGDTLNCAIEVISIVAMLSVGGMQQILFCAPDRREEAQDAHMKFLVLDSDHLTLLNVFDQWRMKGCSHEWATRNYLQPRNLGKAREVRSQLVDIHAGGQAAKRKKLVEDTVGDLDSVRRAVCAGYFFQAARFKGMEKAENKSETQKESRSASLSFKLKMDGYAGGYVYSRTAYESMLTGSLVNMHPDSALFKVGVPPEFVVYHELMLTGRAYMHGITAVEPEWLIEAGPMFFFPSDKVKRRC